MNATVRHSWDRAEVDVWIMRRTSVGREQLVGITPPGIGRPSWLPVVEGVEPMPSFSLPAEAFAALLDAGNAAAHGPAIADAVADARATRDRLLALVERVTV